MFEASEKARVFAVPPGVDFAEALVNGILERSKDYQPEDFAKIELFLNTSRMQRRVREIFDTKGAALLPRIRLITDLSSDPGSIQIPPAVSPLKRRLELAVFVSKLLEREPELASRSAIYELSSSLATLMDEMHGEGVAPEKIANLDVSDQSGHWERSLKFLKIITPFFSDSQMLPDKDARQRLVIEALAMAWQKTPPSRPMIVAGSTGSRGATSLFMQSVANFPRGAVILPGFDFDLPNSAWSAMSNSFTSEDHPQYRFHALMENLALSPDDVKPWTEDTATAPLRNKLISLSLRPAPITDQWLEEGPLLGDLLPPTKNITLVESSSPRAEADTIALRLRQAAQDGITAALISPDRMLTRQVTAALDRWNIKPDDSAGLPLALSPPGRFLKHAGDLLVGRLTTEQFIALLKHPLCHSEHEERGEHLRLTRELELYLRKVKSPFPDTSTLKRWATSTGEVEWASWLSSIIFAKPTLTKNTLAETLSQHINLAEQLAAGPNSTGSGGLWKEPAGREAKRICKELKQAANAAGTVTIRDYIALIVSLLSEGTVRDRDSGHPGILIWGTLEARVQGVGLTILGGMNEGSWPEAPPPDPWLNRSMRAEAGLLLPERKIGLSAHDYQQAIAGKEVWITRAKRSSDAETVPSRWVNRLTNLLDGLPDQNGPRALKEMRKRGDYWLSQASYLTTPVSRSAPASRPAPAPPVKARPNQLSVTQIKTLIRDPFAIYARKILRLEALEPLVSNATPALRGIIIHRILERFISQEHAGEERSILSQIALDEFEDKCPWPTMRAVWLARLDKSLDHFLLDEVKRRSDIKKHFVELSGKALLESSGMTLTCKADRIDLSTNDDVFLYDYKTGAVPTAPQQEKFDKQLLVQAAMIERGAFGVIGARQVNYAAFIGINAAMKSVAAPLKANPTDQVWSQLEELFMNWLEPKKGYTARLALFSKSDASPYDHLSRYGEWDTSQKPVLEMLK